MTNRNLLEIEDLTVRGGPEGAGRILLDRVSFGIAPGEVVGLAGESGSGKSMLALAVGSLLPTGCSATDGRILWRGEDLRGASPARLAALRGAGIAYIFQEPMTALNPTRRVGQQMVDVIRRHGSVDAAAARRTAIDMLAAVRIDDAGSVVDAWPHQLSGGMRQRVLIAMAFSCRPQLIIADEPTTALDVTVQAQVLALLLELARERHTAVLLITHHVGVIRATCERTYVMYAGRVVEVGPTGAVLDAPQHPYTRALLACLPEAAPPRARLNALPALASAASGCAFRTRCAQAHARCTEAPPLASLSAPGRAAACWLNEAEIPA